jgi:hypothetical protein
MKIHHIHYYIHHNVAKTCCGILVEDVFGGFVRISTNNLILTTTTENATCKHCDRIYKAEVLK